MYSESGPDRRADLKAPEVDAIIKDENQQPRADGLLPIKALEAPVRVVLPGGTPTLGYRALSWIWVGSFRGALQLCLSGYIDTAL